MAMDACAEGTIHATDIFVNGCRKMAPPNPKQAMLQVNNFLEAIRFVGFINFVKFTTLIWVKDFLALMIINILNDVLPVFTLSLFVNLVF